MSAQFEAIAQAVIHDWPDYGWSGRLEAAIKQLYLSELTYPATWSSDRCEEFAESHAGDDALLLTSSLDDLIDTDRQAWEIFKGLPKDEPIQMLRM